MRMQLQNLELEKVEGLALSKKGPCAINSAGFEILEDPWTPRSMPQNFTISFSVVDWSWKLRFHFVVH